MPERSEAGRGVICCNRTVTLEDVQGLRGGNWQEIAKIFGWKGVIARVQDQVDAYPELDKREVFRFLEAKRSS